MRSRFLAFLTLVVLVSPCFSQNASTGAIAGIVRDPSGAVVAKAQVTAVNVANGDKRSTASKANGEFSLPLLPPGRHRVAVNAAGFKGWAGENINVILTETLALNVGLNVGALTQTIDVEGAGAQLQTESAELGHVTDSQTIEDLPLVSRNYLQIVGLNPGVSAEITNAADLGRGNSSLASGGDGFSANGSSTNDNNFQMNGVDVNDNFGAGLFTGG